MKTIVEKAPGDPLGDPKDGHILTRAIIDTIREPLIVLDEQLRIIVASRSFYKKFRQTYENTQGKKFYDLGNGQWNIPKLRTLLENVIPEHKSVEGYEVDHDFPFLGARTMLLNAREVRYKNGRKKMLISILDITHQRKFQEEKEKLLVQKDLLLQEMRHRVANSLQLIASILLLKAESVDSGESRSHLKDAHERIMSIATAQQQLDPVELGEHASVEKYLTALCKSLSRSMIRHRKPVKLEVVVSKGTVTSDVAVSLGLITTELVINALKHGFPEKRPGRIIVTYTSARSGWVLSVEDNGIGKSKSKKAPQPGLGTSIIGALANQLQAMIKIRSSPLGTKVSLVHKAL
ncbi:PAS domain-containing protein [Candidatus Parcubacteria bacterium]|nr:MAG: PAS domain-containing protein [Candidatus Parcubacteria bacterium]